MRRRPRRRFGLFSALLLAGLAALFAIGLGSAFVSDGGGARLERSAEDAIETAGRFFEELPIDDGALAFLVMVAVIFFVFLGARRRRERGDDARPAAAPSRTAPARRKNPWADARAARRDR